MKKKGMEALRRVGSFEVLTGGRRRFRNRKKGLYGSSPHHMRKNGMEALRRVKSLEVLRGAGGGFGTGRKDCPAVVPQQPTP